jgi:pyruvate formate lyase activating enzyme
LSDIVFYDVKTLDDEKHMAYTGAGNALILENLRRLAELRQGNIILRVPLIPGYNDSHEEVAAVYALALELHVADVELLSYNASAPAKYEWLGLEYAPGVLVKQNVLYMEELRRMAPEGVRVRIYS